MDFIGRPKDTFIGQLSYSDYDNDERYIQAYDSRTISMNFTRSLSVMTTNQSSSNQTMSHRYLAENSNTTSYPSSAPTLTSNTPSYPNSSVSECLNYYVQNKPILKILYPVRVRLPLNVGFADYKLFLMSLFLLSTLFDNSFIRIPVF